MQTVITEKQNILKTVKNLPDNISIEEAMESLFLLYKIEKGVRQADTGKTLTHSEAQKRMEKWLK